MTADHSASRLREQRTASAHAQLTSSSLLRLGGGPWNSTAYIRVGLPTSVSLIYILHRHSGRFVSSVVLDLVKLTVSMEHHSIIVLNLG